MFSDEVRRKGLANPYSSTVAWRVAARSGGSFPGIRPVFTADKKHILILTSLELRVYSRASKQCLRSIPVAVADVCDLYVDPDNSTVVWIVRSSGKCDIVNWADRTVADTRVNLQLNIKRLLNKVSNTQIVVLAEKRGIVLLNKVDGVDDWEPTVVTHVKGAKLFAFSNSRRLYAFYSSSKKGDFLTVGKLNAQADLVAEKTIKRVQGAASLAVSDAGVVAVGSTSGVIDVYYEALSENAPAVRALKWHLESVLSVEFSADSDYLLSGGKEKVLVFWQLESGNTQFLPRLEGEVEAIYVDPASELFALSLRGEQILVLSSIDLVSRLQVAGVKANFAKLPGDPEKVKRRRNQDWSSLKTADYTAQYYIHPQTKHAYIPTKTDGQVQIYDPIKDEQVSVFSIASVVPTGKVGAEAGIQDSQITQLCFTPDGKWMATVDERINSEVDRLLSSGDKEINLKFWAYNDEAAKWQLATRISAPHGINKSIIDIIPANSGHGFVTASQDGGVRLWKPSTSNEIGDATKRTVSWGVRRILPRGSGSSVAVSISWSQDSSILILGYETSLRLINGSTFQFISTLPNILGSRVRSVRVLGTKLIVLSKTRLVVWDLLTSSQVWAVQVHSTTFGKRLLAVDPVNEWFALACNYFARDFKVVSKIFIFRLDTPLPIHVENHSVAIGALSLVPGTANYSFMDVKRGLHFVKHGSRSALQAEPRAKDDFAADLVQLYNAKKRRDTVVDAPITEEGVSRVLNLQSFDKVFDGVASLESLLDGVLTITSARTLPKPAQN